MYFRTNAHFPGLNGKRSQFHAVVGLHNLRRLDELMATRQERASYLHSHIEGTTRFRVTSWPEGVVHTFKDFTILVPDERKDGRREVPGRALHHSFPDAAA